MMAREILSIKPKQNKLTEAREDLGMVGCSQNKIAKARGASRLLESTGLRLV